MREFGNLVIWCFEITRPVKYIRGHKLRIPLWGLQRRIFIPDLLFNRVENLGFGYWDFDAWLVEDAAFVQRIREEFWDVARGAAV